MKLKLLFALIAAVIVTVGALCLERNDARDRNVFEKNVEALSLDENSEYADCWTLHTDAVDDGVAVNLRICRTCSFVWVERASVLAFCRK